MLRHAWLSSTFATQRETCKSITNRCHATHTFTIRSNINAKHNSSLAQLYSE